MTEREIWVVRHGETAWSRERRHTGRSDVPLSPRGEEQARAVGAALRGRRFSAVLTSPLERARATCRLAGFSAQVAPDLAEWDYGGYEGRLRADVVREVPGWTIWTHPLPGGEEVAAVAARARRVLDSLPPDGDVLVFAHGYLLRVLAALWIEQPPGLGERLALEPGCLGVLGWEYGARVIRAWNVPAER